jgi:hypothetical protein
VDEVDNRGWTALHYAALNGHPACATVLLENDFDPNVCDPKLQTPMHIAAYHFVRDGEIEREIERFRERELKWE